MMASQSNNIGRWFLMLVVSVGSALVSITCSDNPVQPRGEVPVSRESSIIPLAVGNEWRLKVTRFAVNGTIEEIDTVTFDIDSMFVVDGRTWYNFNPNRTMSIRSDGLWLKGIYWDTDILSLPYPAKVGDSSVIGVIYVHSGQTKALDVSVVVATDTMITVPAGTFKCTGYQARYYDDQNQLVPGYEAAYRYTDYYSPGVGFVLIDQYDSETFPADTVYLQFRSELIHATLH